MSSDSPDSISPASGSGAIPLTYRSIHDEHIRPSTGAVLACVMSSLLGVLLSALGLVLMLMLTASLLGVPGVLPLSLKAGGRLGWLGPLLPALCGVAAYVTFRFAVHCVRSPYRVACAFPFSLACLSALRLANWEAVRRKSSALNPEHILLGLVGSLPNGAINTLDRLHVDLAALHAKLDELYPPKREVKGVSPPILPISSRFDGVIAGATRECDKRGGLHIGSVDLLLALLHEKEGLAGKLLKGMGVDAAAIVAEMQSVDEDERAGE